MSVNLNKVALLRNSRRTGVPDVLEFAGIVHDAGADGITVHPRPDERHIRRSDVTGLAALMRPWRPGFELNIEGYPDGRLMALIEETRPEQVTLVPDPPGAFTSEEGWKLTEAGECTLVRDYAARLRALGCRVILFTDPDAAVVARVQAVGADGIEIYTGEYAAQAHRGGGAALLASCAAAAAGASARGMVVNMGHDLNLANIPALVAAIPNIAEASIGHELTADALRMGFGAATRAYRAALRAG
ncbi:MAG: pyridoxine 5'-phosphate synthase [Acetobacteraceae bacterium]|nr:pyridoxine 5'-phosphate synthase [Acetobacteraceae bacterium]